MNLNTMSVEELKSLGYDQLKLLNQTQVNLQLIEQELTKRAGETPEKKGK